MLPQIRRFTSTTKRPPGSDELQAFYQTMKH
jgi:hypothetical protein